MILRFLIQKRKSMEFTSSMAAIIIILIGILAYLVNNATAAKNNETWVLIFQPTNWSRKLMYGCWHIKSWAISSDQIIMTKLIQEAYTSSVASSTTIFSCCVLGPFSGNKITCRIWSMISNQNFIPGTTM